MHLFGRIAGQPQKIVARAERVRVAGLPRFSSQPFPSCHHSPDTFRWKASGRWTSRQVVFADTGRSSSDSTIKSLESILGSKDDEAEDGTDSSEAPDKYIGEAVQRRKVPEAAARRVRPLYVYVIYYCFIVVYLATAWLQATDGDLAASLLVDGLVNDHLAVASGQVPRLATAGFVCGGPLELFLQLATLLTVGAEAEALLGYSLFWAVYWLANLGAGLADAAFSEIPVTFGPANAAAAMVGALAAYYVRNLGLEERIAAARQAVRRRRRMILGGLGRGGNHAVTASPTGSREDLQETEEEEEEMETEVELLPLLSFTFTSRMGPEARGLFNVLVALVMAGQGLLDFGGASSNASWIGLIAAFWTGGLLTYGAGPQYEVQYTLPDFPQDRNSSSSSSSSNHSSGNGHGSGINGRSSSSSSNSNSSSGSQAPSSPTAKGPVTPAGAGSEVNPAADDDGLTVVDMCPPARRQALLGSYVVGLAALILVWLTWMGTDI